MSLGNIAFVIVFLLFIAYYRNKYKEEKKQNEIAANLIITSEKDLLEVKITNTSLHKELSILNKDVDGMRLKINRLEREKLNLKNTISKLIKKEKQHTYTFKNNQGITKLPHSSSKPKTKNNQDIWLERN